MIVSYVLKILPERDYSGWVAIAGTFCVVGLAAGLRLLLAPWLATYPVVLFFPAVFLSALLFGVRAGIFATLCSVLLAIYFFIAPFRSFAIGWAAAIPVFVFALICLAVCAIVAALRRTVQQLRASERRNALLYAEVHHRMRNDLNLISATLELQGRAAPNAEARSAFETAVNRIMVVAAAQGRLKDDGRDLVALDDYLRQIIAGFETMLAAVRPITFTLVADPVLVPRDFAVTIGLIVNELITNSLKYAFGPADRGIIATSVSAKAGKLCLSVMDNGSGLLGHATPGLGSKLVQSLAKKYGGSVELRSGEGGLKTIVDLDFQ